jgi:hypothetical protein
MSTTDAFATISIGVATGSMTAVEIAVIGGWAAAGFVAAAGAAVVATEIIIDLGSAVYATVPIVG